MKLFAIVLFCAVAAVYAMPAEETSEKERAIAKSEPSIEVLDDDSRLFNDLVRDKRHEGYGGHGGHGGGYGGGYGGGGHGGHHGGHGGGGHGHGHGGYGHGHGHGGYGR